MRYYSTTEAAAFLHVDPSRVRLLCKLGRIETIRVGNTYGIAEGEVARLSAEPRRPGRPRHRVSADERSPNDQTVLDTNP